MLIDSSTEIYWIEWKHELNWREQIQWVPYVVLRKVVHNCLDKRKNLVAKVKVSKCVVTFYRFFDVFCKIAHWSVGRPVPPIRFSGPRGTGGKSSRHVWWCCVLYMKIAKLLHNVSSLVKVQERSALKFHSHIFFILGNRWICSEVEVDLTICLDIDCRSSFGNKSCFETTR